MRQKISWDGRRMDGITEGQIDRQTDVTQNPPSGGVRGIKLETHVKQF
jgi:hypothetical protein